jgi:hypothetical protein
MESAFSTETVRVLIRERAWVRATRAKRAAAASP